MAITISGNNNNDKILASDGVIDQISGINIVGLLTASHINVGSNIQLGNAGIITATTFVGNVTGNVNSTSPLLLQTGGSERFRITGNNELGIAGANYGSAGQVLTSGGSGSAVTWSTIPQTTINGNVNNRVITGSNTANTLNGEANLTFDGSTLGVTGDLTLTNSNHVTQVLKAGGATSDLNIDFKDSSDNLEARIFCASDQGDLRFYTGGANERLRINSSGSIGIGTVSPTALLHLHKASGDTIQKIESSNGAASLELRHTNGYGYINYRQDGAETFRVGQIAQFTSYSVYNPNSSLPYQLCVEGNGEVGINTHNPGDTLHLLRNNANHGIRLQRAGTNPGSAYVQVHSNGALSLQGGNNVHYVSGGSQQHVWYRASTEIGRFDTSGRFLFSRGGLTASRNVGTKTGEIQVANTGNSSAITIIGYSNDVSGPHLMFGKTRSTNATGNTIVQDGDRLGEIAFCGNDGSDLDSFGAAIKCHVDGTPGANDMPGRLQFYTTPDGGSTSLERVRIDSEGRLSAGRNLSSYVASSMSSAANDFIVSAAAGSNGGMSIVNSGANDIGSIFFANGTGENAIGRIRYEHQNNAFAFYTDSAERLRITSGGDTELRNSVSGINNSYSQYLKFRTTQSNGQSAITGAIRAQGKSGWGGDLVFYSKPANGSPNDSVTERLRIDTSGTTTATGTSDGVLQLDTSDSRGAFIRFGQGGSYHNMIGCADGLTSGDKQDLGIRAADNIMFAAGGSGLKWRITSSGQLYPEGNYSIGLNSNVAFRMSEVNSNKFVHRYGNSGSATTNQQEAIWYGGGITCLHDNGTLSTSNYTWGLTGSRGYPLFRLRNFASGGAIYAESGTITSGSDYRMKENIEEITNGIETVKKLKPSIYNIRKTFNPNDDGKKHHGFVAHEVQEAIPDIGNIVSGVKDGMEEVFYGVNEDDVIPEGKKAGDSTGTFTDKPDYQGIDYGHMTPILAAAIKELITKVETLESKVSTLEGS